VHSGIHRDETGYSVHVAERDAERAHRVLDVFDAENRRAPRPPDPEPVDREPFRNALLASAGLVAFFLVTGPWRSRSVWFERGSAEASNLLSGEPWRAITALTLHADAVHVASNAVAGALFWSGVCRVLGPGVALGWVVAAGALGNLANAFFRSGAHDSVGASTAVFGAVGILGGLGVTRRLRLSFRGRAAWVPVAASLGILGMLGTAGERVDLWAHAFGLASGLALGLAAGRIVPEQPGSAWQWGAGALGVAAIVGSWLLALGGAG